MHTRLSLGLLCGCWIAAGCPSATTTPDMFDAARDAAVTRDASPSPDAAPGFADATQALEDAATDAGQAPSDVGPSPSDAGGPPPGAWQVTSTEQGGADPATIQRLQLATNRRGDAALLWELYPNKIKGTTYSAATGRWSAVVTLERADWSLGLPAVQVLDDGTALAVWREFNRAGTTLRLVSTRASGGVWAPPVDLATISGSVRTGIPPPTLVADARGRAAVSWQETSQDGTAFQDFVATSTGGRWRREPVGRDIDHGPPRIALDDTGTLHVLQSGRAPSGRSVGLIYRRYTFADDTWHAPVAAAETPTIYPCTDQLACYALAATRTGEVVVLGWDAIGAQGTLRAYVRDPGADTFSAGEVLGSNTNLHVARADDRGARVLFTTIDAGGRSQLESRRWTRAGGWAPAERLGGFVAEGLAVSGNGDAWALGRLQDLTFAGALNVGAGWRAPEAYADVDVCVGRETVGALDDVGSLLVAQICLSPGQNFPFFVRARRSAH